MRMQYSKGDIHMKKQVLIADADEQFRNELVSALEGNEEFDIICPQEKRTLYG